MQKSDDREVTLAGLANYCSGLSCQRPQGAMYIFLRLRRRTGQAGRRRPDDRGRR